MHYYIYCIDVLNVINLNSMQQCDDGSNGGGCDGGGGFGMLDRWIWIVDNVGLYTVA